MLRAAFRELVDGAERRVREGGIGGEDRDQLLRDLAAYRRAVDFPSEREVLHGLEKFLYFCLWYARGNERLRAELEPYVQIALQARAHIGGGGLLDASVLGRRANGDGGTR